jgi:hypothetical protein
MMQTVTTTIKREWFRQIVSRQKKVEYRDEKPYWSRRFEGVQIPFRLRLINGMRQDSPRLTVTVVKVKKKNGNYELHLGRVREVVHWDRKTNQPLPVRKLTLPKR